MMIRRFASCLLAGAVLCAPTMIGAQSGMAGVETVIGTWRNPKGTIDVAIAPCGPNLCGTIVRASPKAIAAAREAGAAQLVGTQLLQDYRPAGENRWAGRVFVPDKGRSFSSRIIVLSPQTLRVSGCLVGAVFCRSQDWNRL